MSNTFQLFDELLAHDPGSKIFFPLARLYRKEGLLDRAIEIMRNGLEHHPDFLEAQLFLIELLSEAGLNDEALKWGLSIFSKLTAYEKFWSVLREDFAEKHRPDLSLASFLFERNARRETIDLLRLMSMGIARYEEIEPAGTSTEPEQDLDAEEVTLLCLNSGIKTKTMAKLLCSQGEFMQAIQIYDDLLGDTLDENERTEIRMLRAAASKEVPMSGPSDKNAKLYAVLDSLASRLEKRTVLSSEA